MPTQTIYSAKIGPTSAFNLLKCARNSRACFCGVVARSLMTERVLKSCYLSIADLAMDAWKSSKPGLPTSVVGAASGQNCRTADLAVDAWIISKRNSPLQSWEQLPSCSGDAGWGTSWFFQAVRFSMQSNFFGGKSSPLSWRHCH